MIEKLRIHISRVFVVLLFIIISVSTSYWEDSVISGLLFCFGIALAGIACLGRLWCSLYIGGYKTDSLITVGPYSMCRNPLYFFSFIGAMGVGFTSETFLIPFFITLAFIIYYPFVIKSEEMELKKLHGNKFSAYFDRVPGFFPKISYLKEPEEYVVKPVVFRKHIADALWFIWLIGILELIEKLRAVDIIPTVFKMY